MKRLTTWTSMDGKAKLIVTDGTLSDKLIEQIAIQRLAEYEDMEEQGLLVRLPCKVGDTVWTINRGKQAIYEQVVTGFSINGESSSKNCIVTVYRGMAGMETYRKWRIQQFGKYVHSTREAAEKALEDA